MPGDQPRQPQRNWRDAAGKTGPTGGQREWQKSAAPGKKQPWSRKAKLSVAGGAFAVVIGLLAWIALWPKPAKPACLVLIGSGYEENLTLPHNALGWKGLEDLAAVAPRVNTIAGLFGSGNPGALRLHYGPQPVEAGAAWDKLWADVPKDVPEKTLILYLALHGASDSSEPFLYLNDARGQAKVPIELVLKSLEAPELQTKNKVLILDATQAAANWPTGQLHNDFVHKLKAMEERIAKIPGLVVFCASDVDQRSWVSEEWQRSIFAHYVIEGLKGAAARTDRRVSALDLFDYVRERVHTWVRANRDAEQSPILLGGTEQAQTIDLVLVDQDYKGGTPDEAPGGSGVALSKALETAWSNCIRLREEVPPPYVSAPHLWRQYQETLVRWEQLERAGDSKKTSALQATATRLEGQLQRARRLDTATAALGNSQPLPAALGIASPWTAAELTPYFDDLWGARAAEPRQKAWDKLADWAKGLGRDEKQSRQLLLLDLSRLLLREAVRQENAAQLGKARDLLKLARDRLNQPLSAEAQFLVMLLRDLDEKTPPPADLLQEALRVRVLAEEAALAIVDPRGHPYSEQIHVKTAEELAKADAKRRTGEDWLFGSDADAWTKARGLLAEARKSYESTVRVAGQVRRALALRDRLMAEVPFLAEWAAGQETDPKGPARRDEIAALARARHRFDRELPFVFVTAPMPPDLPAFVDETEKKLAAVKEDFTKSSRALSEGVHLQSRWREIENVLAVPLLDDVQLRLTLIRSSREISGKLNRESSAQAVVQGPDAPAQAKAARDEAQRRALGLLLLLDPASEGMFTRAQKAPPETWRGTLTETGKEFDIAWQKQRNLLESSWRESLGQAKIYEALVHMTRADKAGRDLPGGLCATLPGEPFGAAEGVRRLQTAFLYRWLADRAVTDHWYADSDNPRETYYEPVALAYQTDAGRFSRSKDDDAELAKNRLADLLPPFTLVKKTGILAPDLPAQHVTTEYQFDVKWKLKADEGNPSGVPMRRLELTGPVALASSKLTTSRRPILDNFEVDAQLERAKSNDEEDPPWMPRIDKGEVVLRGVFRGQRFASALPLRLHTVADTIVYQFPPPPKARVAFRMDKDLPYGAVAFVLDCSGSMNEVMPGQKLKKIDLARAAIKQMLEKLPRGTFVSICTFGYDPGGNPTDVPFTFLRQSQRWNPAELPSVMDKINALVPAYGSPIVRSILEAKLKGFPAEAERYQGPKILLALTDGDDTLFKETKYSADLHRRHQTEDIPLFLTREFKDSDVEINFVCFTTKKAEADSARDQFQVVEKLEPPGNFVVESTPAALADTLEKAIRPKIRLTQNGVLPKGFPRQGLLVTRHDQNLIWQEIEAGSYLAKVQSFFPQNVRFLDGDQLIVILKRQADKIVYERALFGQDHLDQKHRGDQDAWQGSRGDWLASILMNRIDYKTSDLLGQLVALEDRVNRIPGDLGIVQQIRPGFVWLEETSKDTKPVGGLRWQLDYSFPAPIVRLGQAGWPLKGDVPAQPDLNLWFTKEKTPDESRAVEHRGDKALNASLGGGKQVSVGGSTVFIESVKVEDRFVAISPTKRAKKPCLVVRIQHEALKPIWVQPLGLGYAGAELHFHSEAAKTTAIFWDVANPENEAFSLNLISLDALKRTVSPVRLTPPLPTPNDSGPEAPALKDR